MRRSHRKIQISDRTAIHLKNNKYGSGHIAPGIVRSGSYDVTIVCGPKDMSLEKYVLISLEIKALLS